MWDGFEWVANPEVAPAADWQVGMSARDIQQEEAYQLYMEEDEPWERKLEDAAYGSAAYRAFVGAYDSD